MEKIVCVAGPTASGKTKLAVELAKAYDGEVLSCDSMQIYRGMAIGTAAPTLEEMQGVVHHMIGVADPGEDFSVGKYVELAEPVRVDVLCAPGTLSDSVRPDAILYTAAAPRWLDDAAGCTLRYGEDTPGLTLRPGRSMIWEEAQTIAVQ